MALVQIGQGKQLVQAQEYKGSFYLTDGFRGNDGEFHPSMCMTRDFNGDGQLTKRGPLSIWMGKDKEGLVRLAKQIIAEFGGDGAGIAEPLPEQPPAPVDDDIPW